MQRATCCGVCGVACASRISGAAALAGPLYVTGLLSVAFPVISTESSPASRPSSGGQARLDPQGRISHWNAELGQVWGRPAALALGRPLAELVVALDPARLPDFAGAREAAPWCGTVALIPEGEGLPRPAGLQLRQLKDGWELCLLPLLRREPERLENGVPGNQAHHDAQRLGAVLERMPGFCYTVNRELVFTSSAGGGLGNLNLRPGQVVGLTLFDMWGTREPSYEPLVCHLRALAGITSTYQDFCLGRSLEYQIRPCMTAPATWSALSASAST
jgi:hypothetical protein